MRKFTVVLTLSLILMGIFSIIGFAAEELEIIKIGLQYTSGGTSNQEPVLNSTDTYFEFGELKDGQYKKYFDFSDVKGFYYNQDNLYHAAIKGFVSFRTAEDFLIGQGLSGYYIVKGTSYSVYSPGYSDSGKAQAEVDRLKGLGHSAVLEQPNNQLVTLTDGDIFFGFDASTGEYIMAPVGGDLVDNIFYFDGTSYRGGIGAKRQNTTGITLINYVRMNEYLYGVVPREMSKDWPLEALKAQAIVARNFAVTNQNKFGQYGFNLDNTVNSQVYGGYKWEGPVSNQAVDETTNMTLYYNQTLVNGYYHSNSGGYTENSENVWSAALPYIRGVYDPFSLGAPNDQWTVTFSRNDIERKLDDNGHKIGSLENFVISEYTENNRVLNAKFVGTGGEVDLPKQDIRKLFGYNTIKSTLLTVTPDNAVVYTDGVDFYSANPANLTVISGDGKISPVSSTVVVTDGVTDVYQPLVPTQYIVSGKGWGHGLGMSQWGAKQMADQGFTYEQILTFYYTGTHIE